MIRHTINGRFIGNATTEMSLIGTIRLMSVMRSTPISRRMEGSRSKCLAFKHLMASKSTPPPLTEPIPQNGADVMRSSVKDFTSLLSHDEDDATQPIDTAPIYADPVLFSTLSTLHQGQVLKELQDAFDLSWKKLRLDQKRLSYYIAYGDWGVRENFTNWKDSLAPLDLPFTVPSVAKVRGDCKGPIMVHRLPPVILAETPVRAKQFVIRRFDPATKVFAFLVVLVALVAMYRDKFIGEAGLPKETVIVDPYLEAQEREQEIARVAAEQERQNRERRKWYYLWLSR